METKRLTSFSKSSGCGCKIEPAALSSMLSGIRPGFRSEQLILGNEHADDASVFKLNDHTYLLQTTDFFTPVVDDPFLYGQIAAANALSDIWAMGGKPLMANAILGWPMDELGGDMAAQVMDGATEICNRSGVSLAGGHSIDIPVPVFGLSVSGTCGPHQLKTNSDAKEGDILLLTKGLGTGILSAAYKRNVLDEAGFEAFKKQILQLNSIGMLLSDLPGVHAMTDITGFGLVGHLLEICSASGLTAALDWSSVPLIEEAKPLAAQFILPDNAFRNWNACAARVESAVDEAFPFLCDPQTNGPLLISADPASLISIRSLFAENNLPVFEIGRLITGPSLVKVNRSSGS